eukprot:Clim_evm102s25 gene=Clim_evmTU102s25
MPTKSEKPPASPLPAPPDGDDTTAAKKSKASADTAEKKKTPAKPKKTSAKAKAKGKKSGSTPAKRGRKRIRPKVDADYPFDHTFDIHSVWMYDSKTKKILRDKHLLNFGPWTPDEVRRLHKNIQDHIAAKGFQGSPTEYVHSIKRDQDHDLWQKAAQGIRRDLFSIYRRVRRDFEPGNHMGPYTPEEDQKIRDLLSKYGKQWVKIASELGRHPQAVRDRWRALAKDPDTNLQHGRWSIEEEIALVKAVHDAAGTKLGEEVGDVVNWQAISAKMGTRTEKQCRQKWVEDMNFAQKGIKNFDQIKEKYKEKKKRDRYPLTHEQEMQFLRSLYDPDYLEENLVDFTALGARFGKGKKFARSLWKRMQRQAIVIEPEIESLEFPDRVRKCIVLWKRFPEDFFRRYCNSIRSSLKQEETKKKKTGSKRSAPGSATTTPAKKAREEPASEKKADESRDETAPAAP